MGTVESVVLIWRNVSANARSEAGDCHRAAVFSLNMLRLKIASRDSSKVADE